jgi:hypothetical protein
MGSHPFPGGVASPENGVAAIASGGEVTVLDLATGDTIVEFRRACRPLAVTRGWLVAWEPIADSAAAMRLVIFSLTQPDASPLVSEPIALPGWVDVSELPPEALRAVISDGTCTLLWQARRRVAGGALPTENRAARLARAASGMVRIDLRTGAIESSAGVTATPPSVAPAPELSAVASEPGARDVHRIGQARFYLVTEPALLLKARSLADDRVLWEKPLTQARRKTRPEPVPRQP